MEGQQGQGAIKQGGHRMLLIDRIDWINLMLLLLRYAQVTLARAEP
jgi:hypothetical protein